MNLPAKIYTTPEELNEWAAATYGVPTFNELKPEQVGAFRAERDAEWQRYQNEMHQHYNNLNERMAAGFERLNLLHSNPDEYFKQKNMTQTPSPHKRQQLIDEWRANGQTETTIRQKLEYLDKLDQQQGEDTTKADQRTQRQNIKKELADLDYKLKQNPEPSQKAEILRQRFELQKQIER
jgi:hypothetical protein